MDELDARLNESSPAVSRSAEVDAQRTALAYSTERMARTRRGSRLIRVGVPALAALLALGGASAAFATPALQRSLGLSPVPGPTATGIALPSPLPAARLHVLPYPNCRIKFTVTDVSTTALNGVGTASLAAAKQYFATLDEAKLLRSAQFWDEFGEPIVNTVPPATDAAGVALARQMAADMNALDERGALSNVATEGMERYLLARSLDSTVVGTDETYSGCEGHS